jgi:hypothetical protein
MFPCLAEEIAPVRDRGASAGDGLGEDLSCGPPDRDPFVIGKIIDPSPRVYPSLVEDLAGIDIADACYAALIHEERFDGQGVLLGHVPEVKRVKIGKGIASQRDSIVLVVKRYRRKAPRVDEEDPSTRERDHQTGMG